MYASNKTKNLQLPQWVQTDFVRMEDFNQAFKALDDYKDTVDGQIAAAKHDLTAIIQDTNLNVFNSMASQIFDDKYTGPMPDSLVFNGLASASETGTATGFTWKGHPIKLGLYSGGLAGSTPHPDLDIHDASITKTVALSKSYTQAILVVHGHGWYSKTPPMSSFAARIEDYTGITVSAKLNDTAMTAQTPKSIIIPDTETSINQATEVSVPARQFRFQLDAALATSAKVGITFHCPEDRGLWLYSWALILA